MARREKELHHQLHPTWSARDNYAIHSKKKRKRENTSRVEDRGLDHEEDRGTQQRMPGLGYIHATRTLWLNFIVPSELFHFKNVSYKHPKYLYCILNQNVGGGVSG